MSFLLRPAVLAALPRLRAARSLLITSSSLNGPCTQRSRRSEQTRCLRVAQEGYHKKI
jgi:hypothetical protein